MVELGLIESRGSAGTSESARETYDFFLYIAGASPRSKQAVVNVKKLCESSLTGCYTLSVVDILQQPQAAKDAQIIAIPTLIKKLPKPVRLFVGDMSNQEDILRELAG